MILFGRNEISKINTPAVGCPRPDNAELTRLLDNLSRRIVRVLERRGLLITDTEHPYLDLEPGSSLDHLQAASIAYRIAIGDLVRVSYRFRVVPDASANAFIWGYELGLRLGGIRLYVQRSRQDSQDSVPPGVLPVLRNYDDSAVGIGVDLANRYGSISVAAEHRRQTTDVFDYTTNTLRAALGVMVRRNLEASVRGLLMAQRGTEIPLDQLLGEASLEWGLSRALRLRAYVAAWNWDFGLRKEDFLGGGVGLEWNVARLTTLVRFDRLSWENGFDRLENRLYISLTRAF